MQILRIKTYIRLLPTMLLPNFKTVLFAAETTLPNRSCEKLSVIRSGEQN